MIPHTCEFCGRILDLKNDGYVVMVPGGSISRESWWDKACWLRAMGKDGRAA